MLYDVTLRISYEYASLTHLGRQQLRIMPADLPGEQRLVKGRFSVDPTPEECTSHPDFWGNPVIDLAYRSAHTEIAYGLAARVERTSQPPGLERSIALAAMPSALAAHAGLAPGSPHHFLYASPRVRPADTTTDYARSLVRQDMTVAEIVIALGRTLNSDMVFDPDATEVDTPFAEAFAQRRGVCQDFTHIMIACLRGLGIPAGYVSGYLRTDPPPGKPRLEGTDAMHAWVRIGCGPDLGWIEYDPTNAGIAGDDHLIIARGRDYSDVAPVKGILRTAGAQVGKHVVDVVPVT